MTRRLVSRVRKLLHGMLRKLFNVLPQNRRFAIYRTFVDCDPAPSERLVLKIADTKEELEACFTLLTLWNKFTCPQVWGHHPVVKGQLLSEIS